MAPADLPSSFPPAPLTPTTVAAARARLAWVYTHPFAEALRWHEAGVPVVGVTSDTVPWELVLAAGGLPIVLQPRFEATPHADEFLEPDVFSLRIRGIFEGIVSGAWNFLRAVIVPRTSEQEYKLFLYLREVGREGAHPKMPPAYLYDLLHSRSREAYEYGLGSTVRLKQIVEEITGRVIAAQDLARALTVSNAARAAGRRLQDLRSGSPRLSGADAVALIGAARCMDRGEFASLATDAAGNLAQHGPLGGVRLMISGAPLDGPQLHARLESIGALVTAEDAWWGAGADIVLGDDPVRALFDKYYGDTPSPRVPADVADRWFESTARSGVDGVVFYLPPEEYVAGWDYPRRKRLLDAMGIPSLVLRVGAASLDGEWLARARSFIEGCTRSARRDDR
jgi:benzoyl-CoA reductase/2-hydroxyglutaryl-CoA dehydratase subunit BcrC/BadD/HgdB